MTLHEVRMAFGVGDTVRIKATGAIGNVLNADEDEGYLVSSGDKKKWYEEDALEASNNGTPMAIEWIDSNGMRRWEYFPAGDIRSAQGARFWILDFYDVRQIVRTVTDITDYGDLVEKYAKK